MVKKETVGHQGKDGHPARHRDVKVGCVFTQTTWDAEGCAIRDPDSTTYVGAIETAEEFGKRIYLEAWKRGWSRAAKKVAIGDGAEWIWNIADLHFLGAIRIVDLYHARQHRWDLARKLHLNQEAEQRRWMMIHQDPLDKGDVENLVVALRSSDSSNPGLPKPSAPRPAILKPMPSGCPTPNSAGSTCLSARASSKPAARLSSVPAVSSRARSGRYARRTPSWLYDAANSMVASRIIGRPAGRDLHFYAAHPLDAGNQQRGRPELAMGNPAPPRRRVQFTAIPKTFKHPPCRRRLTRSASRSPLKRHSKRMPTNGWPESTRRFRPKRMPHESELANALQGEQATQSDLNGRLDALERQLDTPPR